MPGNTGTGYVNWQDLLRLNQPQAQSMASGLAGQLGGVADNAQNAVTGAENSFNNSAMQGMQVAPGGQTWQDADGQWHAGHANYTGPGELDQNTVTGLQGQVSGAQSQLGQTGSTQGIQALLQKFYGGGQQPYSGGMSRFDAALTGAAGNDNNTFSNLRNKYSSLYSTINDAQTRARSAATGYGAQADAYNTGAEARAHDLNARGVGQGAPDETYSRRDPNRIRAANQHLGRQEEAQQRSGAGMNSGSGTAYQTSQNPYDFLWQ